MNTSLKIAQLSDCHLFAEQQGLHFGANVYRNLVTVLTAIANNVEIDLVIFTGDLSQDHSVASYQLFVQAVKDSQLRQPLHFLAGNHDEPEQLTRYLNSPPISQQKLIESDYWQLLLLNSKSDSPAGVVEQASLNQIAELKTDKHSLLFMHHHPIDVGFGIDQHGLINKTEFWQQIADKNAKGAVIKAVACGHVHRAFQFEKSIHDHSVKLFTCPATSVEFDNGSDDFSVTEQGAGYQILTLENTGEISCELIYFPANFADQMSDIVND